MPKGVVAPPNVYTKALVILSLNVLLLSFVFTVYDIRVQDLAKWTLKRAYEVPRIRDVVDRARSWIGWAKLSFPKPETRAPRAKDKPTKPVTKLKPKEVKKVFTADQLKLFDGSRPSKPVYLAIMGRVYDVEKGRKHYAAGGSYHFFSGRDATRAFVTGDFSPDGLTDDIADFEGQQMLSVSDWLGFYDKEYQLVGVVEGRFYDENGRITEYGEDINERLERALEYRKKQVLESEVFPSCNSEWRKDTGGRVWCTTKSGGVEREWVGVPRRLYAPGSKSYRCACVKNFGPPLAANNAEGNRGDLDNPNLKPYPNCSPIANSCKIESDEEDDE